MWRAGITLASKMCHRDGRLGGLLGAPAATELWSFPVPRPAFADSIIQILPPERPRPPALTEFRPAAKGGLGPPRLDFPEALVAQLDRAAVS
jgi:hypothetical protein